MNKLSILAVVIVGGYIVFELFTLYKLSYRTEPLYIYDRFVAANRAASRCGNPDAEERQNFLRNFGSVTRRATNELAETHPDKAAAEIDRLVAARRSAGEREVDAMIDSGGCDDKEVWGLVRLHEVRARLNLR